MKKRTDRVAETLDSALKRSSRHRDGSHMNRAQRIVDEVKAATGAVLDLRTVQSHLHAMEDGRSDAELSVGGDVEDPWAAVDAALDGDDFAE